MNVKLQGKNKVILSDITDLSVSAELRELCRKHSIQDKCGFGMYVEVLFPDMWGKKGEAIEVMKFLKALMKLEGCCDKGYRFKVTIEQEKIKPPSKEGRG